MKPDQKLLSAGRSCPPGTLEKVVPSCPSCLPKQLSEIVVIVWNGRNKTMLEADSHFSRNEKFPRHFVRYWPRTAQTKRQKQSQGVW